MKRSYTHNHSGIFLMEIIFAILCFVVVSALCLRLFARSHELSQETDALNRAVEATTGIAELLKSADSSDEALALVEAEYPATEDQPSIVTLIKEEDSGLASWKITTFETLEDAESKDSSPIYELELEVYYESQ